MNSTRKRSYDLLGVPVQLWTKSELTDWVCLAARQEPCSVIAHLNLHSLYMAQRDAAMFECLNSADAVHIDGMAVVAMCRALGIPATRNHRVTYIDWLDGMLGAVAAERLRVFFVGGRCGVAERAAEILRGHHRGLELGVHHGYFDQHQGSEGSRQVLAEIARFAPDVLLVGMGMPRQERWIVENRSALKASVCLPCGAAMDYVAGLIPTPPRWAGRVGLEWLFRLKAEPRRLMKRYLIEPWSLIPGFTCALYERWLRRA